MKHECCPIFKREVCVGECRTTENLKAIKLEVKKLMVSQTLANFKIHPDNVNIEAEYCIEGMSNVVHAYISLPSEKYRNRVIASYPATWWDHVKQRLGWKYKAVEVWLHEWVVYPEIPVSKYRTGGAIEIVRLDKIVSGEKW